MSAPIPTGINRTDAPALPGFGVPQPTAEQRKAQEDKWAALRDAPKALAELILFINQRPELTEWARQSVAGSLRV